MHNACWAPLNDMGTMHGHPQRLVAAARRGGNISASDSCQSAGCLPTLEHLNSTSGRRTGFGAARKKEQACHHSIVALASFPLWHSSTVIGILDTHIVVSPSFSSFLTHHPSACAVRSLSPSSTPCFLLSQLHLSSCRSLSKPSCPANRCITTYMYLAPATNLPDSSRPTSSSRLTLN